MKMEPIVSSETSAIRTQTPGNYPKRNKLHLEHDESLKTRLLDQVSVPYSRLGSRTGNPIFCDRPCITKIVSKVRGEFTVTERASSLDWRS